MRPYWHVDAKWVLSLLFAVLLAVAWATFTVWRATAPEVAVDAMTRAIATAFSPAGVDDPDDIVRLRASMSATGRTTVDPLGTGVALDAERLDRMSPREIRFAVFRPVAQAIYAGESIELDLASMGGEATVVDPARDAGPAALVSRESHRRAGVVLAIVAGLAALAGAAASRFSAGLGRLVTPSLVVLVVTLPYLAVASIAAAADGTAQPATEIDAEQGDGQIGAVIGAVAPLLARALVAAPAAAVLAALTALAVAAVLARRGRAREVTADSVA